MDPWASGDWAVSSVSSAIALCSGQQLAVSVALPLDCAKGLREEEGVRQAFSRGAIPCSLTRQQRGYTSQGGGLGFIGFRIAKCQRKLAIPSQQGLFSSEARARGDRSCVCSNLNLNNKLEPYDDIPYASPM